MTWKADALWQLLAAPALLAVPARYAFDWFDGIRKEKRGAKGLAFVCWYGARRQAPRLPRWMTFVASKTRTLFPRRAAEAMQQAPSSRKAIAFIFNSGRVPLSAEDLFTSRALKLALSGDGQLVDVRIHYESEQSAGIRFDGERTFLRRPKNHLTERTVSFAYMAPGHGVAVEIDYTSSTPVIFSLSGPINGLKNPIQQQVLFEVDIEDTQRRTRWHRTETFKLWAGIVMMALAVAGMMFDVFSGGHAGIGRGWRFWAIMTLMMVGEWIALTTWYHLGQRRKVPAALRYWEHPENASTISVVERTSVQ
ncbi:hypothetical protein [Paraburkholderia kururiensis]|jgi:hypothetical protein|uniref:hypothetical protein n=1 Tax=Paraburkholderia kururiensis TaxID=984307 RepID=UPI0018F7C6B0|nr:hypothetical protein [Paraburkholderia kururiensis]